MFAAMAGPNETHQYLNYPSQWGAYSLPIQRGAGSTDQSKIKFHLMQSTYITSYSSDTIQHIHIVPAEHVAAQGKFNLIQIKLDPKSWRTPLTKAVEMGFGVRDKWIQNPTEKSSSAADVQEVVSLALKENPRLFHRLNEELAPDNWNLGADTVKYKRHLKNLAKSVDKDIQLNLDADENETDLDDFEAAYKRVLHYDASCKVFAL